MTEHQKGPRPVSCKINSRFRRFGYGTGHPTGLNMYCIELSLPKARGGSAILRPQDLDNSSTRLKPTTISACTVTMDHDAIVCLEPARPKRAPDKDVHVPSVGSTKVPFSWCRCHILVVEYRWGRMWSNESANTIPTTPCATGSAPRASAVPRPHYLVDTGPNTWTREYQRRHHPDGP